MCVLLVFLVKNIGDYKFTQTVKYRDYLYKIQILSWSFGGRSFFLFFFISSGIYCLMCFLGHLLPNVWRHCVSRNTVNVNSMWMCNVCQHLHFSSALSTFGSIATSTNLQILDRCSCGRTAVPEGIICPIISASLPVTITGYWFAIKIILWGF